MEETLFLGEIKGDTYQSERHSTIFSHKLRLYITRYQISALNKTKSIITVEDESGTKYQVGVCPASTWKSYYNAKNGSGYRYKAGPYYISSLNIDGFENEDIPLFKDNLSDND